MSKEFTIPNQIVSGKDALKEAAVIFRSLGKKALLVTDEQMIQLGNCTKVENELTKHGIEYVIFSDIVGEPTDIMVNAGLNQYKSAECDFIISLGGGSALDTMKAIGSLVVNGGSISDYMGKNIDVKVPPMVAIPTTAGTGSEATQFTIISDTQRDIKMLLTGKVLMPSLAIVDPQFTMTVPPKITAATGMDALCHAIEAYTSKKAQTLSDTFAIRAVKRIFEFLPIAYKDGGNEKAREEMSIAALEAGIAFNNSSVTLIHGMSRPIGALFHVAHGLSNAMLIKECLTFALPGAYDRFAELGREIGVVEKGTSDEEASKKFLDAVVKLVNDLDTPSLKEYGINQTKFFEVIPKMSFDAMDSGSPQNTRRNITREDVEELYRNLWE